MLDDTILRRTAIAYVFRANLTLDRRENLDFYNRVSVGGVEIPDFSIEGSELVLRRRHTVGRGSLEVRVGAFGPAPLRVLVSETLEDRSIDLAKETADLVWEAFSAVWGGKVSEPSVTEVTLDITAGAPGNDSRGFLSASVAHINEGAYAMLGRPFQGFGLRLMSGPSIQIGADAPAHALLGADTQLRIETFQHDFSQLFIGASVTWPALTVPKSALPPEVRAQVSGPVVQINLQAEKPSHYLSLAYDYVAKNVLAFLRHAAE